MYTDSWRDENSRGLALAAAGDWSAATDAFTSAADDIAQHSDVESHDALALVLNNLAQACLQSGRADDAIRHAQRSCALRVALVGEDAIAVARARSELAVILGSADRATEGLALISRAIAGIERSVGDDDIRLLTVLENAARLAMAAGQPSTAEPYLLRLHALLDANGMPVDAADALLSRVVSFRFEQQIMAMETLTESSVELPMIDVDDFGDDEPLADAVATGADDTFDAPVEAVAEERVDVVSPLPVEHAIASEELEVLSFDASQVTPTSSDIFGGVMFDLVEPEMASNSDFADAVDDDDLDVGVDAADVVAMDDSVVEADLAPITSDVTDTRRSDMFVGLDLVTDEISDDVLELVPVHSAGHTTETDSDGGLGFTVEYGATSDAMSFDLETYGAVESYHEMAPANATMDMELSDTLMPAPQTAPSMEASATYVAPVHTTPRGTPVVLPSAPVSPPSGRERLSGNAAPGMAVLDLDEMDKQRVPRKPALRAGRASAPKTSSGMLIAGGVTATIVAGVSWFLFMGR